MRIGIRLTPLGKFIKLEIRGAHAGPGTFCTALGRVIGTGNRTFYAGGAYKFAEARNAHAFFGGSRRKLRRFIKAGRPITMVINTNKTGPGIIESCDTISK